MEFWDLGVENKTQNEDTGVGCGAEGFKVIGQLLCNFPNLPSTATKPVSARLLSANQRAGARPFWPIPSELTLSGKISDVA